MEINIRYSIRGEFRSERDTLRDGRSIRSTFRIARMELNGRNWGPIIRIMFRGGRNVKPIARINSI